MFVEKDNMEIVTLGEIKLVGLTLGKLGWQKHGDGGIYAKMWEKYQAEYLPQVKSVIDPFVGYWFWYNDPADADGYNYFIGGHVSDFDNVDENLVTFTIPARRYIKHSFNSDDFGKLIDVVLSDSNEKVKQWADESGYKIVYMSESPTQSIQVYPKQEFQAEYPSMYTLTPIE
ncbi:MAG: GyrI-like domain-containing protein [Oscillospiraceae bacterium]|nr:GyrI-like domain-containing protein [Oscillospiraceae bacterium]